ncbi:nuclear receptor NHR-67 [Aphelenchoides avenae]|nr:nuclear receptor NHR-67 [Aphelenchus avenae]
MSSIAPGASPGSTAPAPGIFGGRASFDSNIGAPFRSLFGELPPSMLPRMGKQTTRNGENVAETPSTSSVEAIMVRLMNWARSVLSFVPGLSLEEQISTLSQAMSRLFLVTAVEDHKLRNLIAQMELLQLDANEFNVIRTMLLLKEKVPQIHQFLSMNLLQHQQLMYPLQQLRHVHSMVIVESVLALDTVSLLEAMQCITNIAAQGTGRASVKPDEKKRGVCLTDLTVQ